MRPIAGAVARRNAPSSRLSATLIAANSSRSLRNEARARARRAASTATPASDAPRYADVARAHGSRPMIAPSSVVLPAPLGPMTVTIAAFVDVQRNAVHRLDLAVGDATRRVLRAARSFDRRPGRLRAPTGSRLDRRRAALRRASRRNPSPPAGRSGPSRIPCRARPAAWSCPRRAGCAAAPRAPASRGSAAPRRARREAAATGRRPARARSRRCAACRAASEPAGACSCAARPTRAICARRLGAACCASSSRSSRSAARSDAGAAAQVRAERDVVQHRHRRQQPHVLEGAGDARAARWHRRCRPAIGSAAEDDRAARQRQRAADQVEHRALARAVGTDQPEDLAAARSRTTGR